MYIDIRKNVTPTNLSEALYISLNVIGSNNINATLIAKNKTTTDNAANRLINLSVIIVIWFLGLMLL